VKKIPPEALTTAGIVAIAVWFYCRHVRISATGTPSLFPHGNPFTQDTGYIHGRYSY
jgi:hypothetical protein